jgi:hypothetical protein
VSGREPVADFVARAMCEQILAGEDIYSVARRYGIAPSAVLWIVQEYMARVGVDQGQEGPS